MLAERRCIMSLCESKEIERDKVQRMSLCVIKHVEKKSVVHIY